jgi:DNA-binding transcriptional LysR family regulator
MRRDSYNAAPETVARAAMAKLDLEWLQVFDEVFRTRSISRAAEHLGIAQASASAAIQKLRDHFGDPLFTRTPAGMQPTAYASEIRESIAMVLDLLTKARHSHAQFDPTQARRTFRLCATDIRQLVVLPRLVAAVAQAAPQVRIHADLMSEDTPRRMFEGRIELAIGHLPHVEAGFMQRTLFEDDFVCLASARHPRVRAPLALDALLAERHVQISVQGTGPSLVDKALAERGLELEIALRVGSYLPVGRIVAESELLAHVPRSLGTALAQREDIQLLDSPVVFSSYPVRLYWHERFHADPGHAWLRQLVAQQYQAERGVQGAA